MAEISKMLPGYNCGECGHRQCKDYAEEISKKGDISRCRYLELERFIDTKSRDPAVSIYPHCCSGQSRRSPTCVPGLRRGYHRAKKGSKR